MRGGGSALFGASAIAGTINVITKEPQRNMAQISHHIMNVGGSSSWDNVTALNGSLVTENRKAGMYLFAQDGIVRGMTMTETVLRSCRRSTVRWWGSGLI